MNILRRIDSCKLVLVTLPVVLLSLPEGIPFLHAVCTSAGVTGQAESLEVTQCGDCLTDCTGNPDNFALASASECTLSGSQATCEMTATVTFKVFQSGCKIKWSQFCGGFCSDVDAVTGPFSGTKSRTLACDTIGDDMALWLIPDTNDGANPTGTCAGGCDNDVENKFVEVVGECAVQ